jgi:hypothetical protein
VNITKEVDGDRHRISSPRVGVTELLVDGNLSLKIEIAAVPFFSPPGIGVSFGGRSVDLLDLSGQLTAMGELPPSLDFEFRLPRLEVAPLLLINNQSANPHQLTFSKSILAGNGSVVDAGAFGWIDVRRFPAGPSIELLAHTDVASLRPLVAWLESVTRTPGRGAAEKLNGIQWTRCPSWLRSLQSRSWTTDIAPHLRFLRNELKKKGLA